MVEPTGNPLRSLELKIEREGEEYKRHPLAEDMQKQADSVPAVSPPPSGIPLRRIPCVRCDPVASNASAFPPCPPCLRGEPVFRKSSPRFDVVALELALLRA
jgi:hypothetical protein